MVSLMNAMQKQERSFQQHMDVLHKCAALLLEKEKIQRDEFEALFTLEMQRTKNEIYKLHKK